VIGVPRENHRLRLSAIGTTGATTEAAALAEATATAARDVTYRFPLACNRFADPRLQQVYATRYQELRRP
jgi:hypothetical protein